MQNVLIEQALHDRKIHILPGTPGTIKLTPTWISNHMPCKLWDEITYPIQNFNCCTVEVWE